jgi:hypothetical protein
VRAEVVNAAGVAAAAGVGADRAVPVEETAGRGKTRSSKRKGGHVNARPLFPLRNRE